MLVKNSKDIEEDGMQVLYINQKFLKYLRYRRGSRISMKELLEEKKLALHIFKTKKNL